MYNVLITQSMAVSVKMIPGRRSIDTENHDIQMELKYVRPTCAIKHTHIRTSYGHNRALQHRHPREHTSAYMYTRMHSTSHLRA